MRILIKAENIFFPDMGFVHGKSLVIRDGHIERIVDRRSSIEEADALNFPGLSISPVFCDHHLHFSKDKNQTFKEIKESLFKSGITKVMEGGDKDLSGFEMRNRLRDGIDVEVAGYAIYKNNGYGKSIGKGVGSVEEARSLIDFLVSAGADYLKIVNSGIFLPETGDISPGGFTGGELKEIVAYAAGRNMAVICHANGDGAIRDAINAGVSTIVHGFSVSDETLSLMTEKRVSMISTLKALAALSEIYKDGSGQKRVTAEIEKHMSAVRRARDKGIKILPGSDAGPSFLPYGASYLEELLLLRKAGLTDEEILSQASAGPLKEGDRADFLILRGLSVEKVFIDGVMLEN